MKVSRLAQIVGLIGWILVPSTSLLGSERLFLFLFMVECMYLYARSIILTGLVRDVNAFVRIVYECAPLCQDLYSAYIVVAVGILLNPVCTSDICSSTHI